ncbi:hypothetical protein PISL3812_09942 [Talaromyces islandicus]|uniref:WW domain-containing oxidoreductase n=1 Tax=Talaromyces islandicus TaxID=28573 RepID=A0A0U1MBF6_TALIS|nr:hypothetical protein PISL3812_09942 [Talaromyces islandicus]
MSQYAAAHLQPKVAVITGATSGIGLETARALSATGATLFLTARDLPKAKASLQEILEPGRVSLVEMDNSSVESVRNAAATILTNSNGLINILINNAGTTGISNLTLTKDEHEIHFAVNYLSHFLLFHLIRLALLASATSNLGSRVVNVASSAHRAGNLDNMVNYNFQDGGYDHGLAYANSKLATVYMANEIDRRYGHMGLHATSLHPGGINTNISRNIGPEFVAQIMSNPKVLKILKSTEQGAATTVIAAVGKDWEGKGGKYLEDCEEARRGPDDNDVFGVGWVRQTYNSENERRLWVDSLKILGMSDDI